MIQSKCNTEQSIGGNVELHITAKHRRAKWVKSMQHAEADTPNYIKLHNTTLDMY